VPTSVTEDNLVDHEISPVELAAEPGRALTERDTLMNFLGYFRSVLIRKASGSTQPSSTQP
jgi:hypothetical protein